MLCCSSAVLSKNTVAAVIEKPARILYQVDYRCQRGHREGKRNSVVHVSTVVARGINEPIFKKRDDLLLQYKIYSATV